MDKDVNVCDHVDRVSIHPSVTVGGVAVGRCERECLPGMLVCEYHVSPNAIRIAIVGLAKELLAMKEANDGLEALWAGVFEGANEKY